MGSSPDVLTSPSTINVAVGQNNNEVEKPNPTPQIDMNKVNELDVKQTIKHVGEAEEVKELESNVYGKWSIRFRNTGGFAATITTCVVAVFNAFTVNASVAHGGDWPDWRILLIVNVGPILIAWTYGNANKTISTILRGTSAVTEFRKKASDIVRPKTDS